MALLCQLKTENISSILCYTISPVFEWSSQRTFSTIVLSQYFFYMHTHAYSTQLNYLPQCISNNKWYRQQPFLHSPCTASYYPLLSQRYHSATSLLGFLQPSLLICSPLASTSLPPAHTHTPLTFYEELPTATLTVSKSNWVREIHFVFFLFFFFPLVFRETVVMVMEYKDSSGSQCTHEWDEHSVVVSECVFVCPA